MGLFPLIQTEPPVREETVSAKSFSSLSYASQKRRRNGANLGLGGSDGRQTLHQRSEGLRRPRSKKGGKVMKGLLPSWCLAPWLAIPETSPQIPKGLCDLPQMRCERGASLAWNRRSCRTPCHMQPINVTLNAAYVEAESSTAPLASLPKRPVVHNGSGKLHASYHIDERQVKDLDLHEPPPMDVFTGRSLGLAFAAWCSPKPPAHNSWSQLGGRVKARDLGL